MRAAGIQVDVIDDPGLTEQARDINIGFLSRIERGRPWVRLKLAASLDGRTALPNGRSQWITGPVARADGHAWRRRSSAVLTGIGTVLADDPRLDVRAVPTAHQPLRIVLDTRLRTPVGAALLRPPGPVLIVGAAGRPAAAAALREAGAEVWNDEETTPDLNELMARWGQRGINELHVEAGPTLAGSLLLAGLVDELLVYLAPTLLGPGRPLALLPELEDIPRLPYRWHQLDAVGSDLRLLLRRDACTHPVTEAVRAPGG